MAITDETTRTETRSPSYPPPTTTSSGRGFTIGGFVCAAVAILFLPIVLGPVGMVLGYLGHRKGDPLGRWAMGAAFLGLALGMILAAVVLGADGGASSS